MQNKIVKMTRATLAMMVIAWLGTLPALGLDCLSAVKEDSWFWAGTAQKDIQTCLNDGGDVHAKNEKGETLLHWVARWIGDPELVVNLLDAGADVNARDKNGETPLHFAVQINKSIEVSTILLQAGADRLARNKNGETLLHKAAWNRNPTIMIGLLKSDFDVHARDTFGRTPFHFVASSNNTPEAIKIFLDNGADINVRDKQGETPLHGAAQWNKTPETIIALLKAGADAKAKNSNGKTPLDLAEENEDIKGTKAYWALNDALYK